MMISVDEVVREKLAMIAPEIKQSGPWRFAGRDHRGWLVFEPEDAPEALRNWGGDIIRQLGKPLSQIAVTPAFFWWGKRTEDEFMVVTWR